jgi:hypothetical protein
MGAIARQVLQVKRKNSTNCNPPEARLIVVGSVACRSGPREVATGSAVASSLGSGSVAGASVGAATVTVGTIAVGGRVAADGSVEVAVLAGAQAAKKAASKARVRKERIFIIFL